MRRGPAAAETPGGPGTVVDAATTARDAVPFVDLRASYSALKEEIDAALADVLQRSDFILGEALDRFEEDFAAYCGVRHAIGVDSGFSALELILRAHDIGPGDEVITAANTFIATVGAIDAVGARPVLVDVLPDYTMDPEQVAAALTPATAAILPVHLYGQVSDMDALAVLARENGLALIEDACQAHGATYRGRRAGALGDAAAFSFYPAKNLGAFGDGGIVVTSDDAVAGKLRMLRNLGSSSKYQHDVKGFNRRLDTLHAAVLAVKLRHLDVDNARRQAAAMVYERAFDDLPVITPVANEPAGHVFHLYVCQVDQRDELREHLAQHGVASGVHYPTPVHLQPAYRSLGYAPGAFPATESSAARIVSLPMYPGIPPAGLARVEQAIRSFFER